MNRTQRFAVAIVAAVTVTACGTASADATTPAPAVCHSVDGKTDRHCTPGAINPQVTQANLAATTCKSGWTSTVRPPSSFTDALKRQQKVTYGEQDIPDAQLEEDHLVPLVLGGAPSDPLNLWPQPRSGAHPASEKDQAEVALAKAVCIGRMKLADAQAKILTDWSH